MGTGCSRLTRWLHCRYITKLRHGGTWAMGVMNMGQSAWCPYRVPPLSTSEHS